MKMLTPQQMESRMDIRVPARVPVVIDFPPAIENSSLRAMTRDIGFGGAFIEQSGAAPKDGSLARLIIEANVDDPIVIDAVVLHSNQDGIGLMFAHHDDKFFRPLAALLRPEFEKYIGVGS